MKRRFISAKRLDKEIIEVTYRYWFRTRTVKLISFAGNFYELHTDKRFWHFDTLLYKFEKEGSDCIYLTESR